MTTGLAVALVFTAGALAQEADRQKATGPLRDEFYGSWHIEGVSRMEAASMISFVERGDLIETNTSGRTYGFRLDGRDYPTREGDQTVAWRKTGDRSYEATEKANGDVVTVTVARVSDDGKTLRITVTPKSGPAPQPIAMERRQGAPGPEPLIGFWSIVQTSGAKVFEASPNGIRVTSSAGEGYTAAFDGRDYPMTGSAVPPNTVVSVARIDDRTFEETRKNNGAVLSRLRFELSADGRSLSQTFTDYRSGSPVAGVTRWVK